VLSPGGSTHLHTNSTQNNTNNNRTTQITTNVEECGSCPVFASFYPGICLTTEGKARKNLSRGKKTSVRLRKTSVRVQYIYITKTPTHYNRADRPDRDQQHCYHHAPTVKPEAATAVVVAPDDGCEDARNMLSCI
jgi:hypothetical protein